jgi:hypothetical protein
VVSFEIMFLYFLRTLSIENLFAAVSSCGDETKKYPDVDTSVRCWMIFFTDTALSAADIKSPTSAAWLQQITSTMAPTQFLLLFTNDTTVSSMTIDVRVKASSSATYSNTVSSTTVLKGQIIVYRYTSGTLTGTLANATDYQAYINAAYPASSIDSSVDKSVDGIDTGLFGSILGSVEENGIK